MNYLDKHAELLKNAPAVCTVVNDGAKYRCSSCDELVQHSEVLYVVTPDTKKRILCKDCIDPEWLSKAKQLPFSL